MKNSSSQHTFFFSLFLIGYSFSLFGQEKLDIEGFVKDNFGYEVPYAAVSTPSKHIGTSTTEDGCFYLNLNYTNLA
jgi:hypothetical protein